MIESVNVKLGLINDDQVEIVSGVQSGDFLVTLPENHLKAGDSVIPVTITPREGYGTPTN